MKCNYQTRNLDDVTGPVINNYIPNKSIIKKTEAILFILSFGGISSLLLLAMCNLNDSRYPKVVEHIGLFSKVSIKPRLLISDRDQFSPSITKLVFGTISPSLDAPLDWEFYSDERRLILDFPTRIRAGDIELIQMSLVSDESQNSILREKNSGQSEFQAKNLDVYDTHRVTADARLDLVGMQIRPSNKVSEPLLRGQSVTFYWMIGSGDVGIHKGTAWLFLHFIDKVTGEESHKAVSAQILEIEVDKILGFTAPWARILGVMGALLGIVFSYPFFAAALSNSLNIFRR